MLKLTYVCVCVCVYVWCIERIISIIELIHIYRSFFSDWNMHIRRKWEKNHTSIKQSNKKNFFFSKLVQIFLSNLLALSVPWTFVFSYFFSHVLESVSCFCYCCCCMCEEWNFFNSVGINSFFPLSLSLFSIL